MLLNHLLVGAGVLFRGTLGLSPPYTTPAPECRVGDPNAACPIYANCYGTSGCITPGCPGECAPTSSCSVSYTKDNTCRAAGQTCTPVHTTCTTAGCWGACIDGPPPTPTPTPSGFCMISHTIYSCSTQSYCSATGTCITSGCGGQCQPSFTPVTPCRISDPASACPQGMTCTRTGRCEQTWSGCFGSCTSTSATPTFSPTPTQSGFCMISDPIYTCSNTQSSYCSPTGGCTTSRCGGQCQPSPTGTPTTRCVISDPVSTCSEGMTCTQTERCTTGLSGCGGYCTPTYSPPTQSPTPTLRGCKIGDLTSTCSPTDSYTCTPTSPCTTTGCGGLCLSLNPQPTLRGCRIGDPTSTCSPGESSTCTPTSPCTTTGCDGVCVSIGASPTVITDPPYTDTNTPEPPCTDTDTSDPTVITDPPFTDTHTPDPTVITDPPFTDTNTPDPTEPPLKTRTYDCLVSVTSQCLPGYNCEPWYGQCCNSLNCPGRCVKESTDCEVKTKEVLVTTTVTVWHSGHGNGH